MTIEELEAKLDAKTPETEALWRSLARQAQTYSTPLFSVSKPSNRQVLRLAGSGTFVAYGDSHYILTASHVWHEMLKRSDYIGVTLREFHDHHCLLEVATIVAFEPEHPMAWNEWGPDIILLRIPDVRVGEIEAFRVFYQMKRSPVQVSCVGNATYILVGSPSVLGSYTSDHASVQVLGMWVGTPQVYMRDQWDYFDFRAMLPEHSAPTTFGGVSGGGLWQVQIYVLPGSDRIESVSVLEGVAFFQFDVQHGEGQIRCHGAKSIRKAIEAASTI